MIAQNYAVILPISLFLWTTVQCQLLPHYMIPNQPNQVIYQTLKILQAPESTVAVTEHPFAPGRVFWDASDIFRKLAGKLVAGKRLVGIEKPWYSQE